MSSEFESACAHVRGLAGKLGNNDLLYFYARFKQAKEGACNSPKPSFYQLTEKSKWQAWKDLGTLSKEEAINQYIERLDLLEPEWRGMEVRDPTANSGWVSVSCPRSDEAELNDADKTVWDRVKEGDVSGLRTEIGNGVSMKDEAGLTLLHWAADRGHCEVAKLLLDAEPSMLNVQDAEGQTALHYAASCGHKGLVLLLLERGADPNIADVEGETANNADTDAGVKAVFNQFIF